MPTIAAETLGCKVNQYDTQAILEQFLREGWEAVPFHTAADVYLINTCAVTQTGERKSLQAARRAQKTAPGADIILAGCVAQRDGEKLLSTGARLILGMDRRDEAYALFTEAKEKGTQICAVRPQGKKPAFEPLRISDFQDHTRAVLKIQEGCDRYCAYCIIPYCRGGIRSRPLTDIAEEAARLSAHHFRELVLTGIHLTSYGRDLEGQTLLQAIRAAAAPGIDRIRLGSLEPVIVDGAFASGLKDIPQICPQFHLALQSGSDEVLRRMRRRYSTDDFRRAVALLREQFPDCAVTTDIICGFPGETDGDFEKTLRFASEIGFSRIHAFPFSPRRGTLAAGMDGAVPKDVREERVRQLIALGKASAAAYCAGTVGKRKEVLLEKKSASGTGEGYTREYVHCAVTGAEDAKAGDIVPVLITGTETDGVAGKMLQPFRPLD